VTDDLLRRIERYYDAMPRRFSRVEELGPLTLFLGEPGGWTYYARPRLGGEDALVAEDVAAAIARLRDFGLPESVEWVHETTPSLLDAVRAEGSLVVEELPLLALDSFVGGLTAEPPADVSVRMVAADDRAAVAAARAVSDLAFATPGTAIGPVGPAEREAAVKPDQQRVLDLIAEGSVRMAVAEDGDGVLATGRTLPIGDITEVMGVATLPATRRRGLGAAVTAALLDDARALGLRTVFLTAASAEVARVYERVGFRRIGTGYAAERPSG
jgi:GNAT superfamily N-acetyltransferase